MHLGDLMITDLSEGLKYTFSRTTQIISSSLVSELPGFPECVYTHTAMSSPCVSHTGWEVFLQLLLSLQPPPGVSGCSQQWRHDSGLTRFVRSHSCKSLGQHRGEECFTCMTKPLKSLIFIPMWGCCFAHAASLTYLPHSLARSHQSLRTMSKPLSSCLTLYRPSPWFSTTKAAYFFFFSSKSDLNTPSMSISSSL